MISNQTIADLFKIFQISSIPDALFYNFEYSLRIELESPGSHNPNAIENFLFGMDRARQISDFVFASTPRLKAIVTHVGGKTPGHCERAITRAIRNIDSDLQLEKCVKIPMACEAYIEEFGEDLYKYYNAFEFDRNRLQNSMLWLSLSKETVVRPTLRGCDIYLVDLSQGVMIHAYDGRGMDVVAVQRDVLSSTYIKFNEWLLAHDIDEMNKKFK